MGRLFSFYLLKQFPEKFRACGCVSSHLTWSKQMASWSMAQDYAKADSQPYIVRDIIEGETMPDSARLYFDYSTKGYDADYEQLHLAVKDWLIAQDFEEWRDIKMVKLEGAEHKEASWRERVDEQLKWLLQK